MRLLTPLCIMLLACLVAGCTTYVEKGDVVKDYDSIVIRDFGNGVMYFGAEHDIIDKDAFGLALSNYISEHNTTVLAMSPDPAEGAYNSYMGYWVIVKK